MKKFEEKNTENALQEMCKKDPIKFLQYGSDIKIYKDNIQKIIDSLNNLKHNVEVTEYMINKLSSPDLLKYKIWSIDIIIIWIGNLENGRFVKYLSTLKQGFIKSEILSGEYLPDIDIATLSVEPFNIKSFPDKRDLVKHFKDLNVTTDLTEGTALVQDKEGTAYVK